MGLHKEVWARRPINRVLQHGCSPSELQKKLQFVDSLLPTVPRLPNNNGRVIQAGRQIIRAGGQYQPAKKDKPTGKKSFASNKGQNGD